MRCDSAWAAGRCAHSGLCSEAERRVLEFSTIRGRQFLNALRIANRLTIRRRALKSFEEGSLRSVPARKHRGRGQSAQDFGRDDSWRVVR